jgi:ubiquinone/menaquinone biosynthesis C-methylase UbiE
VLEVGCGVGTDGAQFARAGARYTGLDAESTALDLARRRFELDGLEGQFVEASAEDLPVEAESFDLVYSHGVIHHVPDTKQAVAEFHRVLRPGGTALAMIYHRDSLNYFVTIMIVRRLLALALLVPQGPAVISRLTAEDRAILEGHRRLLEEHGLRYLTDGALFLSNNTDGPGNPLSKVYTRRAATELFSAFRQVETTLRYLNLRSYPGGRRFARTGVARRLETRIGWHLYVEALK